MANYTLILFSSSFKLTITIEITCYVKLVLVYQVIVENKWLNMTCDVTKLCNSSVFFPCLALPSRYCHRRSWDVVFFVMVNTVASCSHFSLEDLLSYFWNVLVEIFIFQLFVSCQATSKSLYSKNLYKTWVLILWDTLIFLQIFWNLKKNQWIFRKLRIKW